MLHYFPGADRLNFFPLSPTALGNARRLYLSLASSLASYNGQFLLRDHAILPILVRPQKCLAASSPN